MQTRRAFLRQAGVLTATGIIGNHVLSAAAAGQRSVTLPFENGARELVAFPEKRPLIVLTARPPQLETPFAVFNEGLLTPNDAFFVRYHWSGLPLSIDPAAYRLRSAATSKSAGAVARRAAPRRRSRRSRRGQPVLGQQPRRTSRRASTAASSRTARWEMPDGPACR